MAWYYRFSWDAKITSIRPGKTRLRVHGVSDVRRVHVEGKTKNRLLLRDTSVHTRSTSSREGNDSNHQLKFNGSRVKSRTYSILRIFFFYGTFIFFDHL